MQAEVALTVVVALGIVLGKLHHSTGTGLDLIMDGRGRHGDRTLQVSLSLMRSKRISRSLGYVVRLGSMYASAVG